MNSFKQIYRSAISVAVALLMSVAGAVGGILTDLPTIRVNGKIMYYYDAQSGDNIYTIADKLGVSVEQIRANNPSVADGVKPRMRLLFPSDLTTTDKGSSQGPLTHVVKKGESIYGIAHQYGMTVDELTTLNPIVSNGLYPGQRLALSSSATIPTASSTASATKETTTTTAKNPTVVADRQSVTAIPEVGESVDAAQPSESEQSGFTNETSAGDVADPTVAPVPPVAIEKSPRSVALILPFMLDDSKQTRQTQLYTEFYRGFLLAASEENGEGKTPVKLYAYDSAANLDSVRALMRLPQMRQMNLIVAPDNPTQLASIASEVSDSTLILNVFAVKDTTFRAIPGMIQANIPHDEMYQQAIQGFISRFSDATPVFLTRKNGRTDKEEFTDQLKVALSRNGIVYRTIHFDGYLADADLEDLDPTLGNYVFIPNSGNRDEFSRIVHALKTLKDRALEPDAVRLFGYPEWATFRGDQFREACDLSTTFYSRYNPAEQSAAAREIERKYQQTYAEGIIEKQMPVLGILGYDMGKIVLDIVRNSDGVDSIPTDFDGIQSSLRLNRPAQQGGYFNNSLYLINYLPGETVQGEIIGSKN